MASNSEISYLTIDTTEDYEKLKFTGDDFLTYQKFFLPESNIKKYFRETVSNVIDYDKTTANINHAIQHVTVDPVPFVNQFRLSHGSHHGLMRHEDKTILDDIHNILTGGTGQETSVGSSLIGDSQQDFLVKIHKRVFIGGSSASSPDFNDTSKWEPNLVPDLGLYVRGKIQTGSGIISPTVEVTGNLTVGGELWVGDVQITPSSVVPNLIKMTPEGDLFAHKIHGSSLNVGLIHIHDHYIDHVGDPINNFIITRINDLEGGAVNTTHKTHNAMVVSENPVAPKEGGKVFINVPKENNQHVTWYQYLSNIHPTDSTLWVGGKTTIGVPGNTIATLNLHSGGIISHEHTTFEILHGFHSWMSPHYPSMKIDSTGGLKLQSDSDVASWAELQVGSLNNKVGQKLYGQLRINANTIMPSTPLNAVGEYALAFITEGASGESITGIPIAIRNDSFVGIGTLPGSKRLTVHGGADFINYSEDVNHVGIVTASTFENPGNILDPPPFPSYNGYYEHDGTLLLKGTNQVAEDKDTIGYKYDLILTGNKKTFLEIDNSINSNGKYWGTRIDGRLHLYDDSDDIYLSMDTTGIEFFKNASITLFNGSFKTTQGDFITDKGSFKTLNGDFISELGDFMLQKGSLNISQGSIFLKSYIRDSLTDSFGTDEDGNFKGLSFTIPSYIDSIYPTVMFGIDASGNANLTDLNIYGNFAFKKKTSLDLFGGNLLNTHDINGFIDPLSDGGDGFYGKISGYHEIESKSNSVGTMDETSKITGFYSILGGSSYVKDASSDDSVEWSKKVGRISGFPYIIGNEDHDGIIKEFKDIEGNFNKEDLGDASKAGDIKYYKNLIGFEFTNKDSILFTIPNPSYHAVNNPDVPQNIFNPAYPLYEGGNIENFKSVIGVSEAYYQGDISNFKSIFTQSATFSKTESYIYNSLLEIGERSDSTIIGQQINARERTILFKGGSQNSNNHSPVSFQFYPNIINNPDYDAITNSDVPEYLMKSFFSLHHSDNSGVILPSNGDYSDSSYVDLKVRHIWLDGEELTISASQLNDGFNGGFYSLQGTTPMEKDAPFGGNNLIDVNELQVDYIKNRNDSKNDIQITPNQGLNNYSKGRTIIGDTKKLNSLLISSFNDDGVFISKVTDNNGDIIYGASVDNRSIVIPGIEEVPTRMALMYRDYDGAIKEGISINPDGTVTLPDNPLGFALSGALGFMPVDANTVHIGILNLLGLTMDSSANENTMLGTLILSPSTEEGSPTLSFNTISEGAGTSEDPEFKFVELATVGSLLFKTGGDQKIKFESNIVEIAKPGELYFNEKAKIWYDYTKNNFNLGNYILNPLNTNYLEDDDVITPLNVWKEGISIFYDQKGYYNEEYEFNALRVGIGTTEAYKKEGKKTYSNLGDDVRLIYGDIANPPQFLSDYDQKNVVISYEFVGNKDDFPVIKKGSLISYESIDYQIQKITHINDTYTIVQLKYPLPNAPSEATINDPNITTPAISIANWQHKYTDIATLTVNGLLKADNIDVSSGFSGQALFDQIEVGVDSYLDKAFLKVGKYDATGSLSNEALIMGAGDEPDTDRDLILVSKNGNIMLGDGYIRNFLFDNNSRKIFGYDNDDNWTFQLGDNGDNGALALYDKNNSINVFFSGSESDNFIANNSFDIKSHDLSSNEGLKLAGVLVKSSALELNYLSEVVAGTLSFGKALVVGSDGLIDSFNTSELFINSTLIESSAQELNILKGINLSTDFTLIYKYLNGITEGFPSPNKAIVTGGDNQLQLLNVSTLHVDEIDTFYKSNVYFNKPISLGSNFLKTTLNLDGLITFKENSGSYTPTDSDVGYMSLYAKDKDLYVKYYDDTKTDPIVIKNITAQVASFIRYDDGNNIYYREGNVGIFHKNDAIGLLNAQDKFHLGTGNILLQPPEDSSYDLVSPPGFIMSESSTTKNFWDLQRITLGLVVADGSNKKAYFKFQESGLELTVDKSLNIRAKDKLMIEGEDDVTIFSRGDLSLQPSTDIDLAENIKGSPYHGDLILYDQSYEYIPNIAEVSVGQIAIGHKEPEYWLDIRQLDHVSDRNQYLESDGAENVKPYMVNIQKGQGAKLELLGSSGQLINAETFVTGGARVIDVKASEENSYLTLIGSKKLGIDDNLPTQTFTGRGNLKLWGDEPTVYLGQENSWIENTDTQNNMTNDFQQSNSSVKFLGAKETIFDTATGANHLYPNHRHYGGISRIDFNNDINETAYSTHGADPSADDTEAVLFNQYIDFKFLRISGAGDPRLTKSEDLLDEDPPVANTAQHKYTLDDSGGYFRAMIIDGRTESVGIGQHFKRGENPIANSGMPTAKLDIQGNLNLIAELHEPEETLTGLGAIKIDPSNPQSYNKIVATDGDEATPGGVPPSLDDNYGYGYYKANMGEISIHTEHPEIFSGVPQDNSTPYTQHRHDYFSSSSSNTNHLDIPNSADEDDWGYSGGGYKYEYFENIRISPLRHSFIKSQGNFGIGTTTPTSKLHITNSTLFKDGDVDFKVDFTDIDDDEYLATLKSTKRLFITSDTDDVALTNGTLSSNLDNQLGFKGIGVDNSGDVTVNTDLLYNYATDNISYINSDSNGGVDINEVIYKDLNLRFDKSRNIAKVDVRGTLSSSYTTSNKLFDYHGLTVEMPHTTLPVMRYLPKKVRTGDDAGYITVNKEDPLPKGVPVSIVISYDENGSTASSVNDPELPGTANDSTHKVYLTSHYKDGLLMTVNETNSKYILLELESDGTVERKWSYLYPRVEPERNDFLTIYDATTDEELQIESIAFTGNSESTYDSEIDTDKYEIELKDEWETIDYDTRITSWELALGWDRQKLYHFSVDGYISDSNTTGENWVTLDPSQGHALFIRDKDGNGTHKVLTRSTLDDNIVLNTLLHTEDELNAISIDSTKMINSNFVIGTYHYDYQNIDWDGSNGDGSIKTDGSNVSGQIKRLEFTDSIDAFNGVQPGTANYIDSKSDLNIFTDVYIGNHLDPVTTTELYDGTKSLKLFGNFDLYSSPDAWVEGTTVSKLSADMSGNLTIQGNFDASASGWGKFDKYVTIGTYLNVGTDLDVGGHVTFNDDIFEINRGLNGIVKANTEPTDIPLSGFLVNRGEVSEGNDNSKSAFLWSEGLTTGANDLQKSDQFVLLNNHASYIYDSQYSLDATHSQQRSFEGLSVSSLDSNKTYRIKLYVSGDNFSNVATNGITNNGATGDIFTPDLATTPTTWTNGSIIVDELNFSSYIADFRANDIYAKTLYLPNNHGVTDALLGFTSTIEDDYLKMEASAYELNKLSGTFDGVDTNQFNSLYLIDDAVLTGDDPTYNDMNGSPYVVGTRKTIQWHIHDLDSRKVEMIDYFDNEPENLLINDPKGLKPLDDTPFYIRTKRNDFNNQHKDQFLAITKLDGYGTNEGNNALTDDFLGGALYYDSTTEVTSALDETYKPGDFIIGGYPYRPTTNHGYQLHTTIGSNDGLPFDGTNGTEQLNVNYDPRTEIIYAPDILLQPAKFGLDNGQDILETSGGNVGIGVNIANYKLHVEGVTHANATGEEKSYDGGDIEAFTENNESLLTDSYYRPVVAFFGKNSFDINRKQPGQSGFPIQNGSVRLRIAPRPDFEFDNLFGHERDTNVAEFELNAYESVGIQQGSLGDFNIRNYFSKPTGTGGNINLITAKIPTIAGSQAIFEDAITASFGGLRTHGHMGIGGSPDLGSILKIYGKSSLGEFNFNDTFQGESFKLNASIMFENPAFTNSDGDAVTTKQKFFFLNDDGELQIADSISNAGKPTGVSMEMRNVEIGVAKNVIPTWTPNISRIIKVDTHIHLGNPISGKIYLSNDLSSRPVDIAPIHLSVVSQDDDLETIDQGSPNPPGYLRIRILTSQKTTPILNGSKILLAPADPLVPLTGLPHEAKVLDSYVDVAEPSKYVIVIDFKPLTIDEEGNPIALPSPSSLLVGWESIIPVGTNVTFTHNDVIFSNKVKSIETGRLYDRDVAGGGTVSDVPGSVIVTQDKIGNDDISRIMSVTDPIDSGGSVWWFNGVQYPSRLNLTQYNHHEFNNLNVPRPEFIHVPDVGQNLIVEIKITDSHTDLHDGTQGVDNGNTYNDLSFWSGRVNQNNASNKGKYKWRRSWINGVDDVSIKADPFDSANPMTDWEEDVDYDIFDDYTSDDSIDDYANFNSYNSPALNAHGLQKLGKSGGDITSTLAGNGDFNLFIRFLPIDLNQDDIFYFFIRPENNIYKPAPISFGTMQTPVEILTTSGNSFYLGSSHLQDSRLNQGGFRVASSSIEMVKKAEPIQTWTTPTNNEVPAEDLSDPYVGIFAPFDAGSIFVGKNEASDEQEKLWYMPPRDGAKADDGSITYTESYQAPIDLLAGTGGGDADLSNITMDLIPSEDADYNDPSKGVDIGSIDFDDPTTTEVVESLTRSFRDIFIKGDYNYWNPTTNQFQKLNSASIPYHESTINLKSKISNYTIDESFFTVVTESFDSINHIEFFRTRFDYDPYTGKETSTNLDTDNIHETHDIVGTKNIFTIEFIEEGIGYESITSTDYDEDGDNEPVWVDLEVLYSSPDLGNTWNPTDQLGNPISAGHFATYPEEVVLWSNIKVPQDFDKWVSTNPFKLKLRSLDAINNKVTVVIYDTDKTKIYENIYDGTLTNNWEIKNLTKVGLEDGVWNQGSSFSVKITQELKTPESAIDISYLDFDYDTRFEYTTLLPIVNFTSTTTSTTQTNGLTTLNEPLKIEKNSYSYDDGTNGATSNVAVIVQGHIIPDVPSDESNTAVGWDLGSDEYPFRSGYFSAETLYLGGQKSVAWGAKENDDIGYAKGKVGVGTINPTEALEVSGNIKGSGIVNATSFSATGGTSSDWNTAFTHSQEASGNPHALDINDLTDTTITSVTDDEVLIYATDKWINKTFAEADIATATALTTHSGATDNPHSVDKTQVGLANVDNVSLLSWAGAIDRDLIPDGDETRSLGSADKQWKDLYISDSTLFVGGEEQMSWKATAVTNRGADTHDISFGKGRVGVGVVSPTTEFEVEGISTLGGDVNITDSGNLVVAGTLTGSGYNDSNWNSAYTHSLLTSGNPHNLDTDDVAEGSSNLYITNERVDDRVKDLLIGGTGISLIYDNNANSLTINGSSLYTDDDAQDAIASMIQNAPGITWTHVDNNNGLSTLTPALSPVAGNITGNLTIDGALSATTKSFDIEHPTKEGKRLIHGSLEGAEHGVYVRGKLDGSDEIELPDYWKELVDEDSITVQLTAIGKKQDLWVKDIENNRVFVGSSTNQVKCFYFIQAERKDVEKLIVEV